MTVDESDTPGSLNDVDPTPPGDSDIPPPIDPNLNLSIAYPIPQPKRNVFFYLLAFIKKAALDDVTKITNREMGSNYIDRIKFRTPNGPTLLDITILGLTVYLTAAHYNVFSHNCYWFAFTFMDALKEKYPEHTSKPSQVVRNKKGKKM
ncbi:hypothetical protein AMATHDRAFT_66528, partial [Amanita thiersii Skay4041]